MDLRRLRAPNTFVLLSAFLVLVALLTWILLMVPPYLIGWQ